MPKRKITPERREQRKKLLELLQGTGINDVAGGQELFKEMVGTILENGLEGELDDELSYSKCEYRNKETDYSRNGYSEKTLRSSLGDMEISIPRDRKGEFEPQEVSDTPISRVTDKILPVVKEWQMRPLEETYAVVFMDTVHFHVRSEE